MGIQINIPDTDALTEQDRQILAVLAGKTVEPVAKTAKATPPAKKAAAKATPPTEEEEEDNLLGEEEEPTMKDAVELATKLVSAGQQNDVKGALTDLGVKRVSELKPNQIADFLAALS